MVFLYKSTIFNMILGSIKEILSTADYTFYNFSDQCAVQCNQIREETDKRQKLACVDLNPPSNVDARFRACLSTV